MNRPSLTFALTAMVLWGLWAFFVKLAMERASHQFVLVASYGVATVAVVAYAIVSTESITYRPLALVYAVAGGLVAAGAIITYYLSLESGAIGVATPITGLYFVVAAFLGVLFLNESLSVSKVLGVLLAAASVVLLSR